MPKEFKFFDPDGELLFSFVLKSTQCEARTKRGIRCKRKCIIGFEYCNSHLPINLKLQIKDSTIPNGGKGLFCCDPKKENNEIIFKKGDTICHYNGEVISKPELDRRYGDYTAPYALEITKNLIIDPATKRGVGSIANTKPYHNNAEFSVNTRNKTAKLKAKENIRNGAEIFVGYGHAYRFNEGTHHETVDVRNKK